MSNHLVLFGISFMAPDGKEVFVDSRELAEWQEKYGDSLKAFGNDWNKEVIVLW